MRDYSSQRISTYDTSGANDDGNWNDKIKPGETCTIACAQGPDIIKHIWITMANNELQHLKKIVLRMYWEDVSGLAVETLIGDFFGLGKYFLYESGFISIGLQRALKAILKCLLL